MTKDTKQLLAEALALPKRERSLLATSLIESLDDIVDSDIEDAWEKEIEKRINEASNQKVKCLSWVDVRKSLLETIK